MTHPILVTGAAGRVGGVGGLVVEAPHHGAACPSSPWWARGQRAEALSTASAYRFVR